LEEEIENLRKLKEHYDKGVKANHRLKFLRSYDTIVTKEVTELQTEVDDISEKLSSPSLLQRVKNLFASPTTYPDQRKELEISLSEKVGLIKTKLEDLTKTRFEIEVLSKAEITSQNLKTELDLKVNHFINAYEGRNIIEQSELSKIKVKKEQLEQEIALEKSILLKIDLAQNSLTQTDKMFNRLTRGEYVSNYEINKYYDQMDFIQDKIIEKYKDYAQHFKTSNQMAKDAQKIRVTIMDIYNLLKRYDYTTDTDAYRINLQERSIKGIFDRDANDLKDLIIRKENEIISLIKSRRDFILAKVLKF
jgi:hypothetical protein